MPLIPQQHIVVIRSSRTEDTVPPVAAAERLQAALENYPDCRIVAVTSSENTITYTLTAIIETA